METISQNLDKIIIAVSSAFGALMLAAGVVIFQRKKYRAEIAKIQFEVAQISANTKTTVATEQKITVETKKTEIEVDTASQTQGLKVLDENIESMTDLVKFVQEMGLKIVTLEKEVLALKKENVKVANERDSCEETCEKLQSEIKKLSEKVTKLERTMKKHNIPADA